MFKNDVLAHFDPKEKRIEPTARALQITIGAVSQWSETDPIPELAARRVHAVSKGKLKFRPELYGRVA